MATSQAASFFFMNGPFPGSDKHRQRSRSGSACLEVLEGVPDDDGGDSLHPKRSSMSRAKSVLDLIGRMDSSRVVYLRGYSKSLLLCSDFALELERTRNVKRRGCSTEAEVRTLGDLGKKMRGRRVRYTRRRVRVTTRVRPAVVIPTNPGDAQMISRSSSSSMSAHSQRSIAPNSSGVT